MKAPGWHLILLLFLTPPAWAQVETFYVGTYTGASGSQGIYMGKIDTASGRLGPLQLAAAVMKDPTFLAFSPDGRFLFAALSDAVASFRIQPDGTLQEINRQPSDPNTCHVSVDRSGRELFAASYNAGSIGAYPIDADGRIGARTALVSLSGSGPNLDRQRSPHAHSVYIDPENRFLYACDLGSDRIWIFRLGDKGRLIPADPPAAVVAAGSGPRHLAFSPDGRRVYVANELGVSTSVFTRDRSTGALTLIGTEDNIDPGWPKGTGSAEISLHPSGKWLYVSTRLIDRLTVFKIGAAFGSGKTEVPTTAPAGLDPTLLDREQVVPSPVKFPRSFAIDPSGHWLVVAGETDNRISTLRIDSSSGQLTPTLEIARVGSPVCVLFYSPLKPGSPP
jgi:6-phosphogluconolactonase